MKGKTRERDRGHKKILAALRQNAGHSYVKVGILQKDADNPLGGAADTSFKILDVALVNEFGSEDGHVPERSFMRSTYDQKKSSWQILTHILQKEMLLGKTTAKKALAQIGMTIQAAIKDKILSGIGPENAEATIAKKGSSHTLIDKGQLLNTIHYEVVDRK